jgi:hypothetical protein
MPVDIQKPNVKGQETINGKTIEALQLENEHLNGIISALNLKVKVTQSLEKELLLMRQAIRKSD